MLGLAWLLGRANDPSEVLRVVPAPNGEHAIVLTRTSPIGDMSMVFLSVGLATGKPFPQDGSHLRGNVREILAIAWDHGAPQADKVTFSWEGSERLSVCTQPGTKIERFDALAETGRLQIRLCPELLDNRQ